MFKSKRHVVAWLTLLVMFTWMLPQPRTHAQEQASELLSVRVEAGYNGFFRPNQWFPLQVYVENQGPDLAGRLLVRPETSGEAIFNTFSTPIDIATGSSQVIPLYVTARASAQTIRVELISDEGGIAGTGSTNVRVLEPRERLFVVLSDAATGVVDLSAVAVANYRSQQVSWDIEDIPNRPGALDSIDMFVFSDVDSGTLAQSQQEALDAWVRRGGHLVVTGGAAWQQTASGLSEFLPLVPTSSAPTDELSAVAQLAAHDPEELDGEAIIALGDLTDDAQVLAATEDGTPLIARRYIGNGTVDYISLDLSGQPLRDWNGLTDLWLALVGSTRPQPGWVDGFTRFEEAMAAVEILPGISLLPAALSLIGFLVAYILLVGPLNYLLLSRLNRRELAWLSIPLLIGIFSVLAWQFGAELRGNTVTLSRISVVQTWPDAEEAHLDQLIGLLAPRRGDYTLAVEDDRMLRPISDDLNSFGFVSTNSAVEIRQGANFAAVEFPVDASFIQAFSANGTIAKPEIGGRLSMVYAEEEVPLMTNFASRGTRSTTSGQTERKIVQRLQGTVFNNAEFTLTEPVILARGLVYPLERDLAPGDLVTLDASNLLLLGDTHAPPSPMELAGGDPTPFIGMSISGFTSNFSAYQNASTRTAQEILGGDNWDRANFGISLQDDAGSQERRRRQALLTAFIIDQFASTSRGDRVYLAGWSDTAPTTEQVDDENVETSDTTLYLIELEVAVPESGPARIAQDQFVWISRLREGGLGDVAPNNFFVDSNAELVVRFTPVPTARLERVDELIVTMSFPAFNSGEVLIEVWNWDAERWEQFELDNYLNEAGVTISDDVESFIGPQNAVEVRVLDGFLSQQRQVADVGIEQIGRF